jgi:2-succinyl-6-hydroxy-2,4-cyclohexadiene-1-carboxylate synthase
MGGRVALALCVAQPERVASALLVGTSAGIADPKARAARRREDLARADSVERFGMRAFVDRWMAQPLFESQRHRLSAAALEAARKQRLDNRVLGLANSLRGMGAGAQQPLHEAVAALRVPVCLAVGEEDGKYRDIAADLARRMPAARIEIIPAAGHAAHLENPAAFLAAARRFFESANATAGRAPGDSATPIQPKEVTT